MKGFNLAIATATTLPTQHWRQLPVVSETPPPLGSGRPPLTHPYLGFNIDVHFFGGNDGPIGLFGVGPSIEAVKLDDGRLLWSRAVHPNLIWPPARLPMFADRLFLDDRSLSISTGEPTASAPIRPLGVLGGVLYGVDSQSYAAYDARTLRKLWKSGEVAGESFAYPPQSIGDVVLQKTTSGEPMRDVLTAYDRATGRALWQKGIYGGIMGSEGRDVYFDERALFDPDSIAVVISQVNLASGHVVATYPFGPYSAYDESGKGDPQQGCWRQAVVVKTVAYVCDTGYWFYYSLAPNAQNQRPLWLRDMQPLAWFGLNRFLAQTPKGAALVSVGRSTLRMTLLPGPARPLTLTGPNTYVAVAKSDDGSQYASNWFPFGSICARRNAKRGGHRRLRCASHRVLARAARRTLRRRAKRSSAGLRKSALGTTAADRETGRIRARPGGPPASIADSIG